jgi:hypothetical protein
VESAVDVDVCSYDTNMFMSIWSLVFFPKMCSLVCWGISTLSGLIQRSKGIAIN